MAPSTDLRQLSANPVRGSLSIYFALIQLLLLLPKAVTASSEVRAALSLHLPPTQLLPQPQTLPPSTVARLHNSNLTLTAPLRRNSRFMFTSIPPGTYLCDVWSHEYIFVPMRIDVTELGGAGGKIEAWQTFRGNEWANTGENLGAATANGGESGTSKGDGVLVPSLEVPVGVLGQRKFYEDRAGFNPLSLLKNPMILIGVAALAMMFAMPKLIENMDPEMREEFEKQQASSPFGALAGGMTGQGQPNFDMAAWMAGTDKKDQGKASGADSGSSTKRRR